MPKKCECVAADCSTTTGMGYSMHRFPNDESLRRRWISAVKQQRKDWDGPSTTSLLCSKHFMKDSYMKTGKQYCDDFGIPAQKRLKSDAVPTIFPRSIDRYVESTTPRSRPLSERRALRI